MIPVYADITLQMDTRYFSLRTPLRVNHGRPALMKNNRLPVAYHLPVFMWSRETGPGEPGGSPIKPPPTCHTCIKCKDALDSTCHLVTPEFDPSLHVVFEILLEHCLAIIALLMSSNLRHCAMHHCNWGVIVALELRYYYCSLCLVAGMLLWAGKSSLHTDCSLTDHQHMALCTSNL